MTPRALLAAAALTAALALTPALAEPPSDAKIDEVISTFEKTWSSSPTREQLTEAAQKATEGLSLDEMTATQIGRLMAFQFLIEPLGGPEAAAKRLETFLDDRGANGAAAAVHTLPRRMRAAESDAERVEMLKAALTHPGLADAIKANAVSSFFARLRVPGALAAQASDEIRDLQRLLTPDLAPKLATSFTSYYELFQSATPADESPENKAQVEALRAKLVKLAKDAIPKLNERESEFVQDNVVDYLDGAFARGTLMNGPAPALTVTWSSDPDAVALGPTTLAALKDRVVILDFWATWCGPCVASIPKVRELAARYEGYPVTIIGVTSIQGNHYPGGGEKAIDCKGDPAKEHALMADYIKAKDITWPIVFTEQSCFNGNYGVRGIPHVTMIDPAGNVRHNNLHPGAPLADKAAMIDALLKEFNLPTPEPVPAEGAEGEKKPETAGS